MPSSWTTGVPAWSGSLVASMRTASVTDGRAEVTLMVWAPPTRGAAMSKTILSTPVPLVVLLAAAIASRKLMTPSAPLLASKVLRVDVSPSAVSLAVSTVTTAWVLDTAAMLRANSEVSLNVA